MRKGLAVSLVAAAVVAGSANVAWAAAPTNDDIAAATVVNALPFRDYVNTGEATSEATDIGCGVATVWYEFTPAEDRFVEITTQLSDFNTTLALASGEPGALILEQCNDDVEYDLTSQILAQLTAGVTYYISAGTVAQDWPAGNLIFTLQDVPDAPTQVTITVDRFGSVSQADLVTVSGTISCDQSAVADISLFVRQRFNGHFAHGDGGAELWCGPAPSRWSVQLAVSSDPFVPGPVRAHGTARGINLNGSADTRFRQYLYLRRTQ